jgi:hypothetical protein
MTRWLALILSCGVALSGCGSGSDPASAIDEPVVVLPVVGPQQITISGVVTDAPVVEAAVAITVGSSRFDAPQPSGTDGSYSVEVASDNAGALVRLEAVDPSGMVRLSSVPGDFAALNAAASGGVVTRANITNVTTALDVLVRAHANASTSAQLEDAAAQVDPAELLQIAAAIKLIVEGIDGVTLPDNAADTLALAARLAAGDDAFLIDVDGLHPNALDTAIERLLSDGHATVAFDGDATAGVYMAHDNDLLIALLPDGSGVMLPDAGNAADLGAWWIGSNGRLVLAHDGEGLDREELTQLARTGRMLSGVLRNVQMDTPGAPVPVSFEYAPFDGAFDAASATGSYRHTGSNVYDVLLAGGSGYTIDAGSGVQQAAFDWTVTDSGSLRLAFADGTQRTLTRLARGNDGALRVLSVTRDDAAALVDLRVESLPYTSELVDTPDAHADTRSALAGHAFGVFADAARVLSFGADGSLTALTHGSTDSEVAGTWDIDSNGAVVLETSAGTERYTLLASVGDDSLSVEAEGLGQTWLRLAHADFESLVGSHLLYDANGAPLGETLDLGFDHGGQRTTANGAPESLTWTIDASGRLALDYGSDVTETLYMLAGADASGMPAVRVRRVGGTVDSIGAVRLLNQG